METGRVRVGEVNTPRIEKLYATIGRIIGYSPIISSLLTSGRQLRNELAIAIEVPPHSSCVRMGTFRAFVIQLPNGDVVSRYGQIEAKQSFSKLIGGELRAAEDACIEKPQSCIPCGMKGGDCSR